MMFSKSKTLRRVGVVGLAISSLVVAAPGVAHADTSFHPLTLKNGWVGAPFGTALPQAKVVSGVVSFKGAIATAGTDPIAFRLPLALRPATDVYVKVDLCNAANGRLLIQPTGFVTVEAETSFSDAQCFTSLDGASFALTATKALTLQNGWTNAPFSTSNAAVSLISGIVHFKGSIAGGTTSVAFTLPPSMRPSTSVYVPVDMCNATNGRLLIVPDGTVSVQAESSFSNAQCFTSLDGASFVRSATATFTLLNGWTGAPFSTSVAARKVVSGTVFFKGAISGGTSSVVFRLPRAIRPVTNVFIPVDLCNAHNGRLDIATNGVVSVEAEGGTFSNAQCFTSIDGASFAP
jgi:hypothetical protein